MAKDSFGCEIGREEYDGTNGVCVAIVDDFGCPAGSEYDGTNMVCVETPPAAPEVDAFGCIVGQQEYNDEVGYCENIDGTEDATEQLSPDGVPAEQGAASNSVPAYKFPLDIDSSEHFVMFRISKNYTYRRDEIDKKDLAAEILLPLPANIQNGYQSNYSQTDMGAFGEFVATIGQDQNFSATDIANKFGDLGGAVLTKGALSELAPLASGAVADKLGKGKLSGLAGLAAGGAAQQGIQGGLARAGIALNPHMAMLFTGTQFRTHQFSYKLVARSAAESDQIQKIIKLFSYYMLPGFTDNSTKHFFNYPEQFDITFLGGRTSTTMFDFNTSVLTSFQVNYTGEGTPVFFKFTGAPYSVQLNMTFQEINIPSKLNINVEGLVKTDAPAAPASYDATGITDGTQSGTDPTEY